MTKTRGNGTRSPSDQSGSILGMSTQQWSSQPRAFYQPSSIFWLKHIQKLPRNTTGFLQLTFYVQTIQSHYKLISSRRIDFCALRLKHNNTNFCKTTASIPRLEPQHSSSKPPAWHHCFRTSAASYPAPLNPPLSSILPPPTSSPRVQLPPMQGALASPLQNRSPTSSSSYCWA